MKMIRLWQWLAMNVLAVAMLAPVAMADLPASGGSQTNIYVDTGVRVAHLFTATGSANFVPSEEIEVEYLIVAGGGGGGGRYYSRSGGGGGAGGLLSGTTNITGAQTITVGAGGTAGNWTSNGGKGGDSSISGIATATGGGGGGRNTSNAGSGGSGGGGSGTTAGGAGTAGQGFAGGTSGDGNNGTASGGGGAGGTGQSDSAGGAGGPGVASSITGIPETYAAGGNGGILVVGAGPGASGAANTGDGGDGGYSNDVNSNGGNGGAGGSGIVVIRYKPEAFVVATSATNVTESAADLQGALNATNGTFTVYAFWSTNYNADSTAWRDDDDALSAEIDTYTDVMGQAVTGSVSSLQDGTEYFYTLLSSNATTQVWSPVNKSFTTIARPVVESFADDKLGGPIVPDTLVTYTVTFSKAMDGGTISSAIFTNAGSSAVTFGTVSTADEVVTVEVTPTGDGTLRLGIKAGSTVEDTEGIPLDTSSGVLDDTTITVSSSSPPAVANAGVGAVGIETATLQGQITASNGVLGAVRFYLGTTDENENAGAWDTNLVVAVGSVTEGVDFTAGASDLVAGTEYFYRVYASNVTDDAWSDVASFTTLSEATWTNDASGTWSDTGNWTNGVAGFGGYPAKFDTLTLGAGRTVTLDTAATVGSLVFGDVGNAYGWTLTPDAAETLTLSGVAGIEVVNQSATITAEIAGTDGLAKSGTGMLVLTGANSYTGSTAVDVGTLQVDGSLDAGSAVTVASGATLRGDGTVGGDVTLASGATLSAGSAATCGSLAIGGALALNAGATVALRVNKSGAALSSDLIDLAGAMTYAGTLTVTHSGDALVAGDSFTLFDAPSYGGAFGTVNLPALGADLQWDYSGLTVDGSVVVFSTSLTLDGASGSTQHTNIYSTGGAQATGQGLHVELGFFVDYLIVAGGGGGGAPRNSSFRAGGGGGAGGLLSGSAQMVGATNIVVGAGGAGTAIGSNDRGSSGGNSSAFSQTAIGGGGGGHNTTLTGGSGGSGGGGGISTGGSGIDGQGYDGGDGDDTSNIAGGGGGAGGSGSAITGGTGTISSITGSSIEYARGGDGATAANKSDVTPPPGTANTGNGGKGVAQDTENSTPGGSGGSGIVVIRYPGASIPTAGGTITSFTGNGTIGENGVEYQVHSFTNVGADTFDISGLDLDARLGAEITTAISGEGDLVFNGPGTLTLSGDSTYTGDTIVSNGTLLVTGSLAAGSDVTVKSGASLGGSGGTISGNVTFETGSTFAANGTLTIGGTLTIQSGATLNYSGSATTLATYDSVAGTFDTELNIPDGFNLEYGANTLKIAPTGGSVFRFR